MMHKTGLAARGRNRFLPLPYVFAKCPHDTFDAGLHLSPAEDPNYYYQ
jgi:hypothetical protein